jgi:hypothetical protein
MIKTMNQNSANIQMMNNGGFLHINKEIINSRLTVSQTKVADLNT